MQRYEFKVVPAPRRGEKTRGIRTTEERFANTLTQVLNELGRDGWDYVRADTLPCDERVGLTGSKTSFQNMLVFRRALVGEAVQPVAWRAVLDAGPGPAANPVPPVPYLSAPPVQGPRVGSAEAQTGPAPALGPATDGLAAE